MYKCIHVHVYAFVTVHLPPFQLIEEFLWSNDFLFTGKKINELTYRKSATPYRQPSNVTNSLSHW